MLELLGNPWFGAIAFIVGPAILIVLARRRKALEGGKQGRATPPPARSRPAAPASSAVQPAAERKSAAGLAGISSLPAGFRELPWGSAPAEGMVPVHQEADHRLFTRPSDVLKIGNVNVTSIVYVYHRDRLQAAMVELPASGFDPLARQLRAEWGDPKSWKQDLRYAWSDTRAGEEATQAVLEKKVESRTAKLVVSSKAMSAARAKESGPQGAQ